MKIKVINTLIIPLIFNTSAALAQASGESLNTYHSRGLIDLNNGNTAKAETLFSYSAKEYSFAPSYYELAKIEFEKNTVYSRSRARDYIQKAIWKDPRNIDYKILKAKLLEVFSSSMAYDVYEDILEIDPDNTEALYNLGRISEERFYEYHNSFMNHESGPATSFNDYAYEFYNEAERFFRRAIKSDPGHTDPYLHLSFLYAETGEYEKGIPFLNKVIQIDSLSKNAWLFLGYLYYKTKSCDHCWFAYKKAFDLMTEEERKEFQLNTTMMLMGDKKNEQKEVDKTVNDFWYQKDPLYLTEYNERLLEHYSRIVYSNLRFSVAKQNVTGWKSDRGEVMVRYGEPLNRIRLRPQINAGGRTQLMLKTDLWVYKDKTFGFTDDYWTGDFGFSEPSSSGRHLSQFQFDTYSYISSLRRTDPEEYDPEFKGPLFSLPYLVTQFKDLNNDKKMNTQIYLNYALDVSHYSMFRNKYAVPHRTGLFLFKGTDKIGQKIEEYTYLGMEREFKYNRYEKFWINSLKTESKPDTVLLAFEVLRDKDGGVSTNHFKFNVKDFDTGNLNISDIVLAAGIEKQSISQFPLIRKNISILPNPTRTFNASTDVFIYYEVYNLKLDNNQKSSFEQIITLRKIEDSSFLEDLFSSIAGLFNSKHENEITLTTDYQSFEMNAQVYLQLNLNSCQPGDYIITVTIHDKLTDSKTSSETLLRWR